MKFILFVIVIHLYYLGTIVKCSSNNSESKEMSSHSNNNVTNWVKMEVNENDAKTATDTTNSNQYQYEFTNKRSNPESIHTFTFHLNTLNSDYIEQYLTDVSDPTSKNYGKYLTKQQIDELTIDHEGLKKVLAYLDAHDIKVTRQLSTSIICESSIQKLEQLFNTEFYDAKNIDKSNNDIIHRAYEYYLPIELVPHVKFVSSIIHLPVIMHRGPVRVPLRGQLTVQGRELG